MKRGNQDYSNGETLSYSVLTGNREIPDTSGLAAVIINSFCCRHINDDLRTVAWYRCDLNVSFDGQRSLVHAVKTEGRRGRHAVKQSIGFKSGAVVTYGEVQLSIRSLDIDAGVGSA